MKKILITGIEGFLGSYLEKTCDSSNYLLQGTVYRKNALTAERSIPVKLLDVSDESNVNEVLNDFKPDIIIHTAGNSNVDLAEQHPYISYDATVKGTWNIAKWCRLNNKQLIYCSSNAIFSGEEAPYSETSLPFPINIYGMHKYIAESISSTLSSHLIFRIILMYGWNYNSRMNPVSFIIKALREGKKIQMVQNSSFINPLYVRSCCAAIWKGILLEKDRQIYHLAGKDICDRYQLALNVAKVFSLDESLISPVPDSYYSYLAKRPYNTSYVTNKAERELDYRPISLQEGLMQMKIEEKQTLPA